LAGEFSTRNLAKSYLKPPQAIGTFLCDEPLTQSPADARHI